MQDDEVEFEYAWKNDQWHCLEPLSFDLTAAESIREKAHRWLGQIMSVKDARERFKVYLLLGEPQTEKLKPAFEKGLSILNKMPVEKELISRGRSSTVFRGIRQHCRGPPRSFAKLLILLKPLPSRLWNHNVLSKRRKGP